MFVHVSSHGVVSLEAREDFRAFELRSELQGGVSSFSVQ